MKQITLLEQEVCLRDAQDKNTIIMQLFINLYAVKFPLHIMLY